MTTSNNDELLKDFVKYCRANPEYRFWQALRNWSDYAFIYGSNVPPGEIDIPPKENNYLTDTFYL